MGQNFNMNEIVRKLLIQLALWAMSGCKVVFIYIILFRRKKKKAYRQVVIVKNAIQHCGST